MKTSVIQGVVLKRHDTYIEASLTDAARRTYYAEVDLDRFADIDQPHCVPGTQFIIKEPGPELKLIRQRKGVSGPSYGGES